MGPTPETAGPTAGPVMVPEKTTGLSLLLAAMRNAKGLKKDVYLAFGITDPAYWTKVENGSKPAPRISELLNIPDAVQVAMVTLWAAHLGMQVSAPNTRRQRLLTLQRALTDVLEEVG